MIHDASRTVLVVDDDAAVRRVVQRALARVGCRILCAGSAHEAMQLATAPGERIDVLLTDVMLAGGVGGCALATRLLATRPGLRVLFMSGYLEADLPPLRSRGRFLAKPFKAGELRVAVAAEIEAAS